MSDKIAVIGGGPAGLTAAIKAKELALDVDLFEGNLIGNNIRCAEGFYDSLKRYGKPEYGTRFDVEEVLVQGKNTHCIDARKINLWMIDRKEWQLGLKQKAYNAGVKIFENHAVKPGELESLQKKYSWIIDASGAPSISSVYYGFNKFYKKNSAVTAQYTLQGDFGHMGNRIKFGVKPYFKGYFWIFPKGVDAGNTETANVGIIDYSYYYKTSTDRNTLWNNLNQIVKEEGLEKYTVERKLGGLCPIRVLPQLKYYNILLVGDAAGLTSPLHGGGLDLALISGETAIQAIYEKQTNIYKKTLNEIIKDKLEIEKRILDIWQERTFDELDHLIQAINGKYSLGTILNILKMSGLVFKNISTLKRLRKGLYYGDWSK